MAKFIRSAAERGDAHTGWQNGNPSPRLNKRVRKVYPTSEIPHLWAHQTQEEARNPQGNLFFQGPAIYSYRTNWPLARMYFRRGRRSLEHVQNRANVLLNSTQRDMAADAGVLVLTNCDKYSVTTAGHQNAVNRAIGHLPQIAVPEVVPAFGPPDAPLQPIQHAANMAYLQKVAADHLAAAQRAMSTNAVEWRRREAFAALTDCGRYMGFFKIRRKAPKIPVDAWHAAEERVRRIENPDPESKVARERAAAKRKIRAAQSLQASFEEWRAKIEKHNAECAAAVGMSHDEIAAYWRENGEFPRGDNVGFYYPRVPYKLDRQFRNAGLPPLPAVTYPGSVRAAHTLLRVAGDEIVTSQGARVPLAAAPIVWTLVQRTRAAGAPYAPGLHRIKIGHYPLDAIAADGTLTAGCHVLPYSELELLARKLGLTQGA